MKRISREAGLAAVWLPVCCLLYFATSAAGQGGNKADERKEDQRVKQARQDVEQAQDKLKDAQRETEAAAKKLRAAEAQQDAAVKKAQAERARAEDEQETKRGVKQALEQQATAQAAYDKACEPVLAALRNTPAYQTAVAEAEEARVRLKAVKEGDVLTGAAREARISELTKQALRPATLERDTLAASPPLRSLREKLSEAQAKVAALREEIRQAVEDDRQVRAALKELDAENAMLDKAQAEFARQQKDAAEARARVAREQAQLAQAIAADRRDPNKKNDKKK